MTKTIGVISLGSIGSRHSKNLRELGHYVIAYDPAIAGMLGALTLEQVINDADAFVVASPTTEHLYQFKEYLEVTGKPIFMEKPIADEYAGEMKSITMVGYNLRWHGCVKKAKEWIDSGKIGKALWAQFTLGQYSEKPPYLRDGVILNWSHELDLALYLLGPVNPFGVGSLVGFDQEGKDNIADINMAHDNGCATHVHLDYLTKPEIRGFHVCGDKGRISCDLSGRVITLYDTESQVKRFCGEDSWNDNYIEEMQAFLDRCDGKETIGCTGQEGLDVLKICLEVRKQAGLT